MVVTIVFLFKILYYNIDAVLQPGVYTPARVEVYIVYDKSADFTKRKVPESGWVQCVMETELHSDVPTPCINPMKRFVKSTAGHFDTL